jgi:hypothetical protein
MLSWLSISSRSYDIKMSSMSGFEIGRAVSKMIVCDTHVLSITDRESIIYNNNNSKI